MKKILSILLILIFSIATVTAIIGNLYPRQVEEGDNTLVITMYNQDSSIRGAQVSMYVPFLGVYEKSRGMRISSRDSARAIIEADFPDASPGYYPVILSLEDEDGHVEKTHTWIYLN